MGAEGDEYWGWGVGDTPSLVQLRLGLVLYQTKI